MRHLRYARYLVRHKWFVFLAGIQLNVPYWRLVIHDWSKFLPCEWFPYANFFYGPKPDKSEPDDCRYWESVAMHRDPFDYAWLHHQHRNPHHWQHWVLREDNGDTKLLTMPDNFVREMVADWCGAGRAITGKWDVTSWYEKNAHQIQTSSKTTLRVLELISEWNKKHELSTQVATETK